jgi:TetR/AcrR family transcriptional regulator, transcriptional repressor for nem operon
MATANDSPPGARYRPATVRREQILAAAARLATASGLEDTSIAQVAKAAGVAKGSIYLHFASRDDLIAALQARVWTEMMEAPRLIVANEQLTWVGRLDAIVEHWMRYEFEQHELYHAVFHTVTTESEEPWDEARTLLGRLIAGGVSAGEFDLGNLDTVVVVDFLLHGYVGPCFHNSDINSAIASVQQLFRRTIGVGH